MTPAARLTPQTRAQAVTKALAEALLPVLQARLQAEARSPTPTDQEAAAPAAAPSVGTGTTTPTTAGDSPPTPTPTEAMTPALSQADDRPPPGGQEYDPARGIVPDSWLEAVATGKWVDGMWGWKMPPGRQPGEDDYGD